MPRGRPSKTPVEKTNEKTLGEIKDTIVEGNKTREVLETFTEEVTEKPKKSYKYEIMLLVFCVLLLALGMLERGRFVELVGGFGLILVIISFLYKYSK